MRERDKRRRCVSDGEDAGFLKFRSLFHRHQSPRHAARFCRFCNIGVCHEAVHLAAEASEDRFVDAGLRHLRVGDDVTAAFERRNAFLDGVFGKDEVFGVVKIRRGVDGPLDDELIFRIERSVTQKLRDDLEAACFNVHRFDLFQHGGITPFGMRPGTGRQKMGQRKNENAGSPRRGYLSR